MAKKDNTTETEDLVFNGMPGADAKTEEDVAPFQVDMNFEEEEKEEEETQDEQTEEEASTEEATEEVAETEEEEVAVEESATPTVAERKGDTKATQSLLFSTNAVNIVT